ncbi:unnamed protein product [Rotaria socialis]|uniref:EGF-like domain-containing protein n=1 Tax=Rotaria socialis TaxID=392032 RepID=A0A820PTQ5_9BILA|nr:unnamed protein product [Rotaria socialis]CAF4412347.1 unnamed protein product [Rotaria socialis]
MLLIQHQRVTYGFPSAITYNHPDAYAPYLGVLKVYEDLVRPVYFIMYLLHQSEINITTSPERCPHASSLLHTAIDQSVPDVFKYHHICQNDAKRFCFHDENYLCICQPSHYRTECFGHNIQLDHCDNCLSGGKCIQGDRNHHNDFICLCSSCQQGLRCEFSLQPFSFTLDSLLSGSKEDARSRVKTMGARMTFGQVLKNQFQIQKELYITPIIIVLSALPQTILTFSLACTSLAHWQRHTLLGAYLLSYAPQAFGFILYVLPSTTYKKEFAKTSIGKSYFKLA